MSNDRKLFAGFVGGITMTLATFVTSFIQFRVLLHHLPTATVGIWLIFLNISNYVSLIDLGLNQTLGREVSFTSALPGVSIEDRAARIGTIVRSCTTVLLGLAAIAFLIGGLGGWAYLKTIVPTDYLPSIAPAWHIFIFGAVLNLISEGWFAGIYGLGEVLRERIIRALSPMFGLAYLVVALFVFHAGLQGVAVAYVVQSLTTILMARISLMRFGKEQISGGSFSLSVIIGMLKPSFKQSATTIGTLLILQTDNVVIASTLGPSFVPNYQASAKLIIPLIALSMMMVVTSQPFISKAFAMNDFEEIRRLLNRNLRYTLSVVAIIGSIIACFADRIILVWLGPDHFVGFAIVWIMLGVMLLETHHGTMAVATMATGDMAFFRTALLAGVLNIVFSAILALRVGLIGVALGTFLAQLVTNNWYCPWYTMRCFHLSLRDHLRTIVAPTLLFVALLMLCGQAIRLATRSLPPLASVLLGATAISLCGILYGGRFMLTAPERTAILRRLTGRRALAA
jgi:O-antigen/teichoic acid export membrane protein